MKLSLAEELERAKAEIDALRDACAMIVPRDGVLVIRVAAGSGLDGSDVGYAIAEILKQKGKDKATVLILDADAKVSEVSDEEMNAHGWTRLQ